MKNIFFLSPIVVYASVYTIPQLQSTVNNITDTLSWIIGSCIVLLITNFGIQFILSSDNPQERAKLKTKIVWSIIGLFIVIFAKDISIWIQNII